MSGLNFKEALATVSRALTEFLVCAGAFVASGFLVLIQFGMLLFALRLARARGATVVGIMAALVLLGGWVTGFAWRRFFLYRRQAAMLFLFSGGSPSQAAQEAGRFSPTYSRWAGLNRCLRRALCALRRGGEFPAAAAPSPGVVGWLAEKAFSRAILALAFSRGQGNSARSIQEGLALYWLQGARTRRLARRWLGFSAAGLALLFLCLVLSNWLIFSSAGAPVGIGIALAAVIAWTLHQAFIAPLALAGVSAALLAETRGCKPDPALCEKLASLLTP